MSDTEWFCGRGVDDESERKDCRKCIWILVAVAVILGLLVGCAQAAETVEIPVYVLDDPQLRARLLPSPCENQVVRKFIKPAYADKARAVEAEFKMMNGEWRSYAGCWLEFSRMNQHVIGMIFEDGDYFALPKSKFLDGKGLGT